MTISLRSYFRETTARMLQRGIFYPKNESWLALTVCSENEVDLTPSGFHDFVVQTRREISNRRLLNQSCIVNVGDEQGNTGQVAHTARGAGIREGVAVTFTVVSVAEVIWVGTLSGGHRQIIVQSFVRGLEES
jgi:hypothetical protein